MRNSRFDPSQHFSILVFAGMIFLLALLIFYPLLSPGHFLLTTDNNIGTIPPLKKTFPAQLWGDWSDGNLCGSQGGIGYFSWTYLVLGLLPEAFGFNWLHAIDLVLASIFLFIFLRSNGLTLPSIIMGALTAFWLGNNFTLTYAGHIGKFAILMLSAAALVCLKKINGNWRDWAWCAIAGGLMGMMFIEQQDVALFLNIFLGAYALFRLSLVHFAELKATETVSQKSRLIARVILSLLLIATTASAVTFTASLNSYFANVKPIAQNKTDDAAGQWEFTTQWSWPPEECIDFIAPGYMGWRSGEPEGPYWGRMGRSAGWEQTHQGFMNFKLENQYLGAIPLFLALFAIFVVLLGSVRNGRAGQPVPPLSSVGQGCPTLPKAEIIFLACAAIVALLLSFGKYFPLYSLFYHLPLVSSIRNPNKFLHVFQIALGILAAYGFELVLLQAHAQPEISKDIATSKKRAS